MNTEKRCPAGCPYSGFDLKRSPFIRLGSNPRVMLISHRGDERVLQPALFGDDHYQAFLETDSGRAFLDIMNHCGLDLETVALVNAMQCLLPQSAEPMEGAYDACALNLNYQIQELKPQAMVTFGDRAFATLFPVEYKARGFFEVIGETFNYSGRPTLAMHHYSRIHRLPKPAQAERIRTFLAENRVLG